MSTVTVHLGLIPVDPMDWTDQPLSGITRPSAPYPVCTGTSFDTWSEVPEHGDDPHLVTVDLEAPVFDTLNRDDLGRLAWQARRAIFDLVPLGWRLVDYVVVTDADDQDCTPITVGRWDS